MTINIYTGDGGSGLVHIVNVANVENAWSGVRARHPHNTMVKKQKKK